MAEVLSEQKLRELAALADEELRHIERGSALPYVAVESYEELGSDLAIQKAAYLRPFRDALLVALGEREPVVPLKFGDRVIEDKISRLSIVEKTKLLGGQTNG